MSAGGVKQITYEAFSGVICSTNDVSSKVKSIHFAKGSKSITIDFNLQNIRLDSITFNDFGKVVFDSAVAGRCHLELRSISQVPGFIKSLKDSFGVVLPAAGERDIYKNYEINQYDSLSLTKLAHLGDNSKVEWLLKNGQATVNEKDEHGQDLLHIAFHHQNKVLAETALKYYANINSRDTHGKTILKLAVENGDKDWYHFAIKHGATRYDYDENKDNLLHIALKAYKALAHLNQGMYDQSLRTKQGEYKDIIHDLAHNATPLLKDCNKEGTTPFNLAYTLVQQLHEHDVYNDLAHEYSMYFG